MGSLHNKLQTINISVFKISQVTNEITNIISKFYKRSLRNEKSVGRCL